MRTIGDLATVCTPVSGTMRCTAVDGLFRADRSLRSVVIDDAGSTFVLNRDAFYQGMTGRLGFGWALRAERMVTALPGLRDTPWRSAEERVDRVAIELVASAAGATDLLVRWPDGRVGTVAVHDVLAELSQLYRDQLDRVKASEKWFRALARTSGEVVLLLDENMAVKYMSPSAMRLVGGEATDRIGRNALDMVHPDDVEHLLLLVRRSQANPGLELTSEFRMQVADGAWRQYELRGRNLLADPDVGSIVVNYRDVTERKALEDQLRHQAFHDELTGLPNRLSFAEQGRTAIARLERSASSLGVLVLDLDGFKSVNDSLGHQAGDLVLQEVARRLEGVVRAGDVVARLGGDEFAVLCEASRRADLEALAGRIVAALSRPVAAGGHSVLAQVSVGVAIVDGTVTVVEELLRRADLAMYAAKAGGRNRWLAWSAALQTDASGHVAVAADLHRALECDELVLHYQPVRTVATGDLVGFEALVRWQHPVRGLIPPSAFIPVAEQSGLVVALGRWVLNAACDQARRWRERFPACAPLVMAVNVSPVQLHEPRFPALVADALARSGMDPATLELEITEEAVVRDPRATERTLAELKELGVRLAIDDFGTGYSSLSHLRRYPVDTLKIDRSFVDRLDQHAADLVMVENMITLGHALGMEVIAEGVEEEVQLAHLRTLRCDRAQGYLLGRPRPHDAIAPLLAALDPMPVASTG